MNNEEQKNAQLTAIDVDAIKARMPQQYTYDELMESIEPKQPKGGKSVNKDISKSAFSVARKLRNFVSPDKDLGQEINELIEFKNHLSAVDMQNLAVAIHYLSIDLDRIRGELGCDDEHSDTSPSVILKKGT